MRYPSFSGLLLSAIAIMTATSCGGSKSAEVQPLPDNFSNLPDVAQVDFMMKHTSPDSVARFICNASLGKAPGAALDSLNIAVAYAYTNYNDSNLIVFSREFDDFSSNLPLNDKMKIYSLTGKYDPQRLGYELGLEYVNHIRESRMTVEQIRRELKSFREVCDTDSDMFIRFMKGFKTVLRVDHGKDLPEDIYQTFIEY